MDSYIYSHTFKRNHDLASFFLYCGSRIVKLISKVSDGWLLKQRQKEPFTFENLYKSLDFYSISLRRWTNIGLQDLIINMFGIMVDYDYRYGWSHLLFQRTRIPSLAHFFDSMQ